MMDYRNLLSDFICQNKGYKVLDERPKIMLESMENPFQAPAHFQAEMAKQLASLTLNRYPKSQMFDLKQAIANHFNVPQEVSLMLGNGSDELIQIILLATKPNLKVALVSPCFSMYQLIAQSLDRKVVHFELDDNFDLNQTLPHQLAELEGLGVVFLANPNNPTGNTFNPETIINICKKTQGLVVVDEAYFVYQEKIDVDFLAQINQLQNLIVMRTFSKLGFAGIRLGMMAATSGLIALLEKARLPYNLNQMSEKVALLALENWSIFQDQINQIKLQRTQLKKDLSNLKALQVFPSQSNFILTQVIAPSLKAGQIAKELFNQSIAVKCLDGYHPRLKNCLRITVGSPTENQTLVKALEKITQPY